MTNARVVYNGFGFPENASYNVSERYIYDEAELTVIGTEFHIRVKAFLAPEVSGVADHTNSAYYVGPIMHGARQKLSKAGASLVFEHDGFGPTPGYISINTSGSTVKDVEGGPKPRLLRWNPVGNTACVEIEWECTTVIPICDGGVAPRFTGLKAFNYWLNYDIDESGYTTRRIAGYIEIAMTRNGRSIPDTIDNYRNQVKFQKPNNFQRKVSWSVSADKRRADFSIVDTEHRTSNPFPPGVIDIQARHRVAASNENIAKVGNVISASITLSPLVPRRNAWDIFAAIVLNRRSNADIAGNATFLESIEIEEEIFANRFAFQARYYTLTGALTGSGYVQGMWAIDAMLPVSGVFQPLGYDWQDWSDSVRTLEPLQGVGYDGGLSLLSHDHTDDRIIDLCDGDPAPTHAVESIGYTNTPTALQAFKNVQPTPVVSWLKFDSQFSYSEGSLSSEVCTLGPDDLTKEEFDPTEPTSALPTNSGSSIERFVEQYATGQKLNWKVQAIRAGYPIKLPSKIKIGAVTLQRAGRGKFHTKQMGSYFGVPVYAAIWNVPFKLTTRISDTNPDAGKPFINDPGPTPPPPPPEEEEE